MTNLYVAAGNFPVIGIIYALAVLFAIAAVCFAVVKLSGRGPRNRAPGRGAAGANNDPTQADNAARQTSDT